MFSVSLRVFLKALPWLNLNKSGYGQTRKSVAFLYTALLIVMCGGWNYSFAQAQGATTTTLAITASSGAVSQVVSGSVVTLTATVQAGNAAVTPGQVDFCDASAKYCTDVHLLGIAQLTSGGTATLKFRPGMGTHSYKAVFLGTSAAASSASSAAALKVTGTIGPLATTTALAQNGSWGNYTLTATLTEAGRVLGPTGTVSFLDSSNGNSVLAAGNVGSAVAGVGWSSNSLPANGDTSSVLVGDFNGDGIPDLAVNTNQVAIYLGKADGTYAEAAVPSVQGPTGGPMIMGDFNGDGIPDLALALYASADIAILLGKGDGTFAAAVESTVPGTAVEVSQLATADFNGDGIADLAVIDRSGSTMDILLGNGDGTFTAVATNPPSPVTPLNLAVGDFNGDGKVDLAVMGSSGSIAILLGKGDGTFTAAGTVVAGVNYSPIAVADFNGDGKLDLAVGASATNGTRGSVIVLTGNGDGTFNSTFPGQTSASTPVTSIQVADFNQDGAADVVVTDQSGNLTVLLNNGSGLLSESFPVLTVSSAYSLVAGIGDINGDGYPDLVAAGYNQGALSLLLTEPTETVTVSADITVTGTGQHLVDASYSGDGNFNSSVSGATPLWGVPPATTTTLALTAGGTAATSVPAGTVVTLTATVTAGSSAVTAGQVNFCDASATACTDIHLLGTAALTGSGTATFKFVPGPGAHSYVARFVENGFGLSSASAASALTVGSGPSPAYTDITTIATTGGAGNYTLNATVVGLGGSAPVTGNVSFVDTSFGNATLGSAPLGSSVAGIGWLTSLTPATSANTISEVTGDFNGDGIPDLAVISGSSSESGPYTVSILLGKGDGTFTSGAAVQLTGVQEFPSMVAGDFNGDGKTDLAILASNGNTTSYITTLLGKGDGTFGTPQTGVAFAQGVAGGDYIQGSMVAADFNGDGKMDLAIVGDYISTGGVIILLGNGDGTFQATASNVDATAGFALVATGDFNGDGIPDLVVPNYFQNGGSPIVFLGKGDGTFTAMPTSFTLDYFPTSVVVGDFNGDGILDLAFSDLNGVEIALGKGDGTFKETTASPISVPSELHSLVTGDFNHDGKVDLAGLDPYNNRIVLLLGGGDGAFTVTATTPGLGQQTLSQIVAADFNGDGVSDLAMLTQYNTATVSILLNEPTSTATASISNIAPIGAGTHNVEASYGGDKNYPSSVSATTALTAGLAPLVITPAPAAYTTAQTITISESVPGATIYYAASGTVNTNGFVPYTGPIQLTEGGMEIIYAYATENGYGQTNESINIYTLNLPLAPAPAFSVAAGNYQGAQTVSISDTVSGAAIYYTTNGTFPTLSSAKYSGPITVSTSETLVAAAIAPGYSMSTPASAQYIIDSSSGALIYTIAGNGSYGFGGDGGLATLAQLTNPGQTALDNSGNLYIADMSNHTIRKVTAATHVITTVAGNGTAGYSGDSGAATSAQLYYPNSVAVDPAGNLYIADSGNNVIRKVAAATGIITTIVGNGTGGYSGDNGAAISAELNYPEGIAWAGSGNLLIADSQNERIRNVNTGTGIITTVAGSGTYSASNGDGGPATSARIDYPSSVAVDGIGNFYIASLADENIRKVTSTGMITTVAGIAPGQGTATGDGGPATNAQLYGPSSVAVDGSGNLYIADTYENAIRKVTASTGIISTVAGNGASCYAVTGDGGPAASAALCYVVGVTADSAGNLYISDSNSSRVREVTVGAVPTTATAAPTFSVAAGTYANAQTVTISDATPGAAIYVSFGTNAVTTISPGYLGTISVTGSETIHAIAVAPGNLTSAPASGTYTITTPPSAVISTVVGNGVYGMPVSGSQGASASITFPSSEALDKAGNLYFTDSGNNMVWKLTVSTGVLSAVAGNGTGGYGGDGGPATDAELNDPVGIAVDGSGNVFIADTNNDVVRMVTASTGIISTFAGVYGQSGTAPSKIGDGGPATSAYLANPAGLVLDSSGNLYIADLGHSVVRIVSAATGIISTFAGVPGNQGEPFKGDGGPATSAQLSLPNQLAIDTAGNVYICDVLNSRVRKVTAATGIITTVAGNGIAYGAAGDGGPATSASLIPEGIAVDGAGNLYISNVSATIRKVDAGTGIITRIAGNGYQGYFGDGGSATIAELNYPMGLALDLTGNLYIADQGNYRVRMLSFPSTAATPVFSLGSGSYVGSRSVTITDGTTGAAIYYTTDGTTPSSGSTLYSGAITISATETIQAIAIATGYTESAVASAAYTITKPATPTINWATPSAIYSGTALSSTQLDATASVAGTFAYTPAAGTILAVGSQKLSVTFTPTDTVDYTTATGSVTLTVLPAKINAAVTVTPATATITNAQTDAIGITVAGASGQATPTGTVTLSSGTYSAQQTLTSGAASITIPAGALGNGANTLTATYSGDGTYVGSSGTASVTVTQIVVTAPTPTGVAPGSSTTSKVSFAAGTNYSGTMNVSCSLTNSPAGAQSLPTCTVSPTSVTIASGGTGTTTLTVQTTAASNAAAVAPDRMKLFGLGGAGTLVAGLLMLGIPARRRRWLAMIVLLAIVAGVGAIGCGGGGSNSGSGGGGTPATTAGTYMFKVTGVDSANATITIATNVTVTVE